MRLSALHTPQGFFHLFEVPPLVTLAAALGLDLGVPDNQSFLQLIAKDMLKAAEPEVSGLVLEPDFGLDAFLDLTSPLAKKEQPASVPGLVLHIEIPNHQHLPSELPQFSPNWGVEQIRNNYAVAFLELWYDPREAQALEKKQIVGEIGDFCQSQDIDFILKLEIPTSLEMPLPVTDLNQKQLTAVQELRSACQLLVLQPPQDPLAAATLTAELDIPWVMSSAATDFGQFTDRLRQALDNGAVGALSNKVVWQDMTALRRPDQGIDQAQLETFIAQEIPARLKKLEQVINETVKV